MGGGGGVGEINGWRPMGDSLVFDVWATFIKSNLVLQQN